MNDVVGFFAALGVHLPDRDLGEASVSCFARPEAHSHGDRNKSTSINLGTGAWCCHACEASGGPYHAALELGRTPREAMDLLERHGLKQDSKRPTTALSRVPKGTCSFSENELAGFRCSLFGNTPVIERLIELRGWTREAIGKLELGFDGERVVIPTRDSHGRLVGVVRYQPNPDKRDGAPKMVAVAGSRRELFPAPEALYGDKQLFLVEGEGDAVSAHTVGLSAVAIPGVQGWRPEWASRFQGRRVVVSFDCDEQGRAAAKKVAADVSRTASEVRVLDLGGEDGYDLGDFLRDARTKVERETARQTLLRAAESAPIVRAAEHATASSPQNSDVPASRPEEIDGWPKPPAEAAFLGLPSKRESAATAESVDETAGVPSHSSHISNAPRWPDPLGQAAFHGLAGKFVRAVEPHSEADLAGLLTQYLAMAGNLAGSGVRCRVESDAHPARLYVLLVGDTAKARKGTAWGRVRDVAERVDSDWAAQRIMGGLASGEGLIAQLRDPTPDEEGNMPAPADRRLLVVEGEFARVLKVAARESNTLSPVLRTLWDRGDARTMTRTDPLCATGAHVSITAHITERELRAGLPEVEIANGFANRFAFVCVRRSKLLPRGGSLSPDVLKACGRELSAAIEHAHRLGDYEIDFNSEAGERWEQAYVDMAQAGRGLLGSVTARAEAQVIRLAVTYAILDCSREIELAHLEAALEVWGYCERSATHIFGDATGDRLADRLLAELRAAGDQGLSRSEIRERVGSNNVPAERIKAALATLHAARLAERAVDSTNRGRPVERWVSSVGGMGAMGNKSDPSSRNSHKSHRDGAKP